MCFYFCCCCCYLVWHLHFSFALNCQIQMHKTIFESNGGENIRTKSSSTSLVSVHFYCCYCFVLSHFIHTFIVFVDSNFHTFPFLWPSSDNYFLIAFYFRVNSKRGNNNTIRTNSYVYRLGSVYKCKSIIKTWISSFFGMTKMNLWYNSNFVW